MKDAILQPFKDLYNEKSADAIFALIYTAIILTCMDYFFIPPRLESIISGNGVGGWYVPSLTAGLGWVLSCLLGFLVLPAIFIKFIFKKDVSSYGFSANQFGSHLKIYLGLFLFMFPFIYIAAGSPAFRSVYPFVPAAKTSITNFLIWEVAYLSQFFALEFFFRGYLLYTLEKHMNKFLAIAVMVVPYTMIHFHKPYTETFGAVIAGCVLGFLSLKYRSWLGGALLHSLVAISADVLASFGSGLFNN